MKTEGLKRYEIIFLIVTSVLIMLIVSASSPIYPFNEWDDVNVFFTVGRNMLTGSVPYRDLYEQKGPLFLMIYALSALISRKTFIGIWLFECLSACLFSVMSWKTVKLFVKDIPSYAIGIIPVYVSSVFTIGMFNFGGNTEEFAISLLSVVLYIALKMIVSGPDSFPDNKEALVCGVIASVLFWSKYTLVGLIAAFAVFLIIRAVRRRLFQRLGKAVLFFLTGFVSVSLIVFIYFAVNGSLKYLWDVYFYNNIFNYYSAEELPGIYANPLFQFFIMPFLCLLGSCRENPDYSIWLILSFIGAFLCEKRYRKTIIAFFLFAFFVCVKLAFTRDTFIYYYGYPLAVFFIFGLILICRIVTAAVKLKSDKADVVRLIFIVVFIVAGVNILIMCKNLYLLSEKREELTQFEFAKIIDQTDDPRILTYDIIDGGFYLAAGVSPCNRYFTYMNNIENNEEAVEEQQRLISEGYFDYIITYDDQYDWENYEMVAEGIDPYCDFTKENYLIRFCLYQRVSD